MFLLGGILIGFIEINPTGQEFASIIIVYLLVHAVRLATVILLFPLLSSLGYGLSLQVLNIKHS